MHNFVRILNIILISSVVNIVLPVQFFHVPLWTAIPVYIASAIYLLCICINPSVRKCPTFRLKIMDGGAELLYLFSMSLLMSVIPAALSVALFFGGVLDLVSFIAYVAVLTVGENIVFWNGIIRVYCTSSQLGLKTRALGIIFGMVPVANLIMLGIIYAKVRYECDIEIIRHKRNAERKDRQICKTKYPLLMVHGVFFRDSRLLNYWGRIPAELKRNGAEIYYGNQQSAASVENSATELAERIKQICAETGCEKVNIIAHSKGGLDSRYAISRLGCAEYVASLTTICTPHKGCIFAEYLLGKAPEGFILKVENTYNKAFTVLGDEKPDFLAAVKDLTNSNCKRFNEDTPDAEGVLYQSFGSVAARAQSGRFPLNVSYPIVKKYDGENDGMVALSSMQWGESFTAVHPKGERGITHGDMIDLNREDFRGFDVMEFYVDIVSALKNRGF